MDDNFFTYLQQLQLMVFFSGYPLLYAVAVFICSNLNIKNNFTQKVISKLPFTYALLGTIYLGFVLKNLYPDYSIENIKQWFQLPFLEVWGLLSILFWIPVLANKTILSLLHSLVFFYLLLRDLIFHYSGSHDNSIVKNDMNVYTVSLLINLGALVFIVLLSFLFIRKKKQLQ